jgi:bifunctional non-homologous end joining protein LigD
MSKIEGAVSAPIPRWISPMHAMEQSHPFDREGWLFEPKFDGYRGLAVVRGGQVTLFSREENIFSQFSQVTKALARTKHDVILDGEIVAVDEKGKINFNYLGTYGRSRPGKGIECYCVFDLLHLDGESMLGVPLTERKKLLRPLVPRSRHIMYTEHMKTEGTAFFAAIEEQGMEGMIAKKAESPYRPGRRSRDWIKVKSKLYVRP